MDFWLESRPTISLSIFLRKGIAPKPTFLDSDEAVLDSE